MKKIFITILFLLLVGVIPGCAGGMQKEIRENLRQIELPDLGVTLLLPGEWDISYENNRFYQLTASGFTSNGRSITFEFRSLETRVKGQAGKNLFATGWFQSPLDNYSDWKYIHKNKIANDAEGAYEMEGTFSKDKVTYRRYGKLKFHKTRVHALYYTVSDTVLSDNVKEFINTVNAMHKFDSSEK